MSEAVELKLYSPLQVDVIDRDFPGHAVPLRAVSHEREAEYLGRIVDTLPWLRLCVKEITATNIGARHSLLGLLCDHAPPAELLPPSAAKGHQKKKKVPER